MKNNFCLIILIFILCTCKRPQDYREQTEEYVKNKNYELALHAITKAIQLEPDSVHNYYLRALIFDLTAKFKEEILDLNKIIELNKTRNSKSVNAIHQRAVAEIELGMYKDALSDIDYFIDNRDTIGSLAVAYLNKAWIFYKLNDFKNSEKFYKLTLSENNEKNKNIESQAVVGLANLAKSPIDGLELINKAILLDDSNFLAYGARAAIYIDLNKIDLAYEDYKKAISFKSNYATLFFNMGQLLFNYKNDTIEAVKYFERALELSPQSPENEIIYMNLGAIKHHLGNLDDALTYFEKVEEINPNNDVLLYNLALLFADLNRNFDALEKINKAININSKDADYFDTKGTILATLSSFKEAKIAYKTAIKMNPKLGGAYYNLGYIYGKENNHEESISYYNKAVLLNFDLETTLINRALEKIAINEISSACDDIQEAINLGRNDVIPLLNKHCK